MRAPTAPAPSGTVEPGTVEPGPAPLAPRWHVTLWLLVLAVLATGLFVPDLMAGDASQDAVMAMRMFRDGDWVNLLKNGRDYLDKPHLLFWSAMAGYHLFGVHDWSYRLFSVLVTLLGAFSTGRLARRLYGVPAGQLAALAFVTAQATLLGNHDVRMDALLTGFTAFGLWQLVRWAETEDLRSLALGAVGIGLAVSAKGMVAVALSGLCLFLFLWGRRRLRLLASPRILVGVAAFALTIAPVVLCYYLQFDLHPEKVIGGRTGVSGVRFILLGQSADRFTGGHGHAAATDYLFFYHSLLWAFLPWTALLVAAWVERFRALARGGLRAFHAAEQLSLLGPVVYVSVLNLSAFKLPHYLNVVFPLLAVATAGGLVGLSARPEEGQTGVMRLLTRIQDLLLVLLLAAGIALNGWSFPVRSPWVLVGVLAFVPVLVLALRLREPLQRLWVPSAVAILLFNFVLEASFYPQLTQYQPGSELARKALALPVDWDRFFFVGDISQPFQLYARRLVPAVGAEHVAEVVADGEPAWALVNDAGRRELEDLGLRVRELASSPSCRITMIRWALLDPRTRDQACPRARLVEIGR